MPSNNHKESAEFFLERGRRISQKVTALSRKEEELSSTEVQELDDAIRMASLYSNIGLGYAMLASLENSSDRKAS